MNTTQLLQQLNPQQKEILLSFHDVGQIVDYGQSLGIVIPQNIAFQLATELTDDVLEGVIGGASIPRKPTHGPMIK